MPSAQEVGSYLDLRHRIFPDGTSRLSVSARGLWTICLNGVFFPQWSKTLLARLADKPRASFTRGGRGGDIFIDAAEIPTAIGNSSSKRSRAVIAIVDARRVEDAVKSGVRSEMLAISAMTSEPSRARIQERLDPESVGQASSSHRASGGRQSDEGSTDESESTAGDLTLLVPILASSTVSVTPVIGCAMTWARSSGLWVLALARDPRFRSAAPRLCDGPSDSGLASGSMLSTSSGDYRGGGASRHPMDHAQQRIGLSNLDSF